MSVCFAAVFALALAACSSNGDDNMDQSSLDALQEAFGDDQLTPEAITALLDEIETLMMREDISPADVQALRDQVATLMMREDISPADVQALRDQVATLMMREDISPADVQALRDQVAALMVREDISPEDVQALRDQIAALMAGSDITPEEVQALRDQVAMLMMREDITPEEVQALRDQITALMASTPEEIQALQDQITMLMMREDITPEEVQALRDRIVTLNGEVTDLMGRADITAEDVQALRDQITSLTAQVTALMATTPEEIQALQDQITMLMMREDITPEEVQALRDRIVTLNGEVTDLMGRADITAEDVQALRDQITSLTAQVTALMATTPEEIQALQDQITDLTSQVMILSARPDITAEGVQALRNEIAILMLRATISQADYNALVAALGDMPLTVATLEMLVADYNKNKQAAVNEEAAEASARALGILAEIMTQTVGGDDQDDAITAAVNEGTAMPFTSLTATNTMADGVAVLLNADNEGESAFEEATDRAAPAINGWDHVLLAKEADDDSSTEYVAVYTDVDLPGPKSLLLDEGVTDTETTIFFVVTDDPDGTGPQTDADADEAFVMLAHTDMFPSAPATGSTTVVLGNLITRPGTATQRLEFPGTWRGVPGTFICSSGACDQAANGISVTAMLDSKGEEDLTADFGGRGWVFQPDDKAATADVADEDYLYFGWWKNEPVEAEDDDTFDYGFRTFASGSQPFTPANILAVEGRATYSGAATGKYALEKGSRLAPEYEADAFTARASLTANFGSADVAGSIKGTITDFVNANPDGTSLANWKVTLNETTLTTGDASFDSASGTADDNAVAEIGSVKSSTGVWSGAFFGNGREDGQPGSVAGRFSASFTEANTHIAGSYGAHNVSPDE
jgi:predicted  nucleic acid-binding Zn-ribbon protein